MVGALHYSCEGESVVGGLTPVVRRKCGRGAIHRSCEGESVVGALHCSCEEKVW